MVDLNLFKKWRGESGFQLIQSYCTSMQVHHHNDQSDQNEVQIFEHLSTFIQLFRRSVALSQLIASLVSKEQDYRPIIQKIKLVFEQLQPLKQHYQSASGAKVIRQTTFHRFTCRLLEILYLYLSKQRDSILSHPFSCFQQSLKEIQTAIKQYEESRSFFDIIKIVQLSFLKFFINCRKTAKKVDEESERKCQLTFCELKMSLVKERKQYRKKIFKTESLGQPFDSDQSEESEKVSLPTASMTSFNKPPTYNRDLLSIQKRFDLFRGLDLDFSSFRCDFFIAKNSKDIFFKDCLKRNEITKKFITTYHDDFYLFQKKRINKENKRNKLKLLYGSKNVVHHSGDRMNTLREIAQQSLCQENNLNFTCDEVEYGSFTPSINPDASNTIQTSQQLGSRSMGVDNSGKKQLVMKNIQLSLGKNKIKQPTGTHNIFRNMPKAQPINQSYYNQLQTSSKNSLDFLHSRLRIQPNSKLKPKPAIQQDQKPISQNNQFMEERQMLRRQIDPISLSIKSRSTFKGKYLQINCLKKNETQHKRRVFHNGASITKINIKNGYKIQNNRKVIINIH